MFTRKWRFRAITRALLGLALLLSPGALFGETNTINGGVITHDPNQKPPPLPQKPFPDDPSYKPKILDLGELKEENRQRKEEELRKQLEKELKNAKENQEKLIEGWGSPDKPAFHQEHVELHSSLQKYTTPFDHFVEESTKGVAQWEKSLSVSIANLKALGIDTAKLEQYLSELKKYESTSAKQKKAIADDEAKLEELIRQMGELDREIRKNLPDVISKSEQLKASFEEYKKKLSEYANVTDDLLSQISQYTTHTDKAAKVLNNALGELNEKKKETEQLAAKKDVEKRFARLKKINELLSTLQNKTSPFEKAEALNKLSTLGSGAPQGEELLRVQTSLADTDGNGQLEGLKNAPRVTLQSAWLSKEGGQIRYDVNVARATYQLVHDKSHDSATEELLRPIKRTCADVLVESAFADRLIAKGMKPIADRLLSQIKDKTDMLAGFGKGVLESGKELKEALAELPKKISNRYEKFLTDAKYSGPDYAVAGIMADGLTTMKETAAQISKLVRERRDTLLFGTPEQQGKVIGKTTFDIATGLVGEEAATQLAANGTLREAVERSAISQAVKEASREAVQSGKLSLETGRVLNRSADVVPRTARELIRKGGAAGDAFAKGTKGVRELSDKTLHVLASADESIADLAKKSPMEAGAIYRNIETASNSMADLNIPEADIKRVANSATHIFGPKSLERHQLAGVLEQFAGDSVRAFKALENAAPALANEGKIAGVFETNVRVKDTVVTIRGKVVDGVARIGTAFVP